MAEAAAISRRIYRRYGDEAVIQPYLEGFDVRVSFMNGSRPDHPSQAGIYRLAGVEGGETGGAFMTMADNWTLSATRAITDGSVPSPFPDKTAAFRPEMVDLRRNRTSSSLIGRIEKAVNQLAAFFELRDIYTFDFRVTPDGVPYFLEFEVCPAVTIYDFQIYLQETYGIDLPTALLNATTHAHTNQTTP